MLNLILRSPSFKKYKYSDHPDLKKDAAVSRAAAAEGMVLMKNENHALPIKTEKKIAVFGNGSYDIIAGGTGSGNVNKAYTISLIQGLANAGYEPDASLAQIYEKYLEEEKAKRPKPRGFFDTPKPVEEMSLSDELILSKASETDIAIYTIGRNAGEGADRKLENDFYLSPNEKDLIGKISQVFHAKNKKLIVVLNIGGVIEIASWRDQPDAILLAWQPGLEGGNAIADILSGKVNPSGRLASSFPVEYKDVPGSRNFPGKEFPEQATTGSFGRKEIPAEVVYQEGIYVGYRYYNTFNIQPAYEFGYGLSYTNFNYGDIRLSGTTFRDALRVTITVTNKGQVAGKEVVQLYISAPAKKLDKPEEELKAFGKTRLLQPGQSQTITFTLHASDLASFDTQSTSWIAEAGNYTVKIGSSSRNFIRKAGFALARDIVVEKDHRVLAPEKSFPEYERGKEISEVFIYEPNNFIVAGQ